jgi:hypothetical protein
VAAVDVAGGFYSFHRHQGDLRYNDRVIYSPHDCGSATVLVALVAEDLGAGPAAVVGCIGF